MDNDCNIKAYKKSTLMFVKKMPKKKDDGRQISR